MVITDTPIDEEIGNGSILNKEISRITDMMTREEIKSLVEVFYHPVFKTFYVNSLDGKSFVRNVGIFVSLGMTTSMKVIEDIRDIIEAHNGYSARLAEISSKKVAGQFMNTVTKTEGISQYELTEFDDTILDREKALEELENLKSKMNVEEDLDVLKDTVPKLSKLSGLVTKLDESDGWKIHLIQKGPEGEYRIFHKLVNYRKDDDIEYRIGIYVTETN